MKPVTKNYAAQGGKRWVIRGELDITEGGKLLKDGAEVSLSGTGSVADGAVTTAKLASGAVTLAKLGTDATNALNGKLTATKAAAQADSTATDVAGAVADLNALLAKLRAAGIIAT